MLWEVVMKQCHFFSSNHYKAIGCDSIHFNCPSEYKNARRWAKEVYRFVKKAL